MPSSTPSPCAIPATVGTLSSTVLQPNISRLGVYLFNPSATVIIWVAPLTQPQTPGSPGGPANPAVVNGTGSIPIQPQQGLMLGAGASGMPPFTNGLNAICGTPSTPLTIWEFYQ